MNYISELFPTILEERKDLIKILHVQQFIEYVKQKDFQKAITYSQKYLAPYQKDSVYCLDSNSIIQEVPIDVGDFYISIHY